MGRPAVPAGSPSSLQRVSWWRLPRVKAVQLCLASQYCFFVCSMKRSASSSEAMGATVAIKRDFFSTISPVPP